jgi:DNA-3-methyladenine glycosylase II
VEKHIQDHFRKNDPILYKAIFGPVTLTKTTDYFAHLCEAIISQQLSEKAGSTIWNRFVALFPDKKITPELVLAMPDEKIRAVGPSRSKISYLKNLAMHTKLLDLQTLGDMKNEDVVIELTKVKGIGPWTAEMFLMFALGRPDVFSFGDLGLRNAIKKLYKLKKDPTKKQMEKITKKWSPYRTYACRILWKSLEL